MLRRYDALENFEAPSRGEIKKGMRLELDDKIAAPWVKAGLIFEVKTQEKKTEVKVDG